MGNKLTVKVSSLCVGCMLALTPFTALADSTKDLNNQKQSVLEDKKEVTSDLDNLSKQIQDVTGKISNKQIEIGKTQEEVDNVKKEIEATKKRIADREDLLKDRLNAVYKQGGSSSSYLEILLGSKDFGDFINRATALYKINKSDQEMIDKQKKDQELLKEKQEKVEKDLKKNKDSLNELNDLVANIQKLQNEKEDTLASLNGKLDDIDSKLAKEAKAAAERKAKATASSQPTVTSSSSSKSNGSSSSSNQITQFAFSESITSGSVSDLINSGRRFIGNSHYVFGAMDPAGHNFDCSGFVNWAYQQIGINLGARSTSGLQYVGVQVSASNMKPGDLVFFDTYQHNGHVAIYAGGGQFIGSQSSTGVAFASMSNSYWKSHFNGYVRRVLQ